MRYKDYCDMLDKFKPDFKKQHIAFRTDSGASRSYLVKKSIQEELIMSSVLILFYSIIKPQ